MHPTSQPRPALAASLAVSLAACAGVGQSVDGTPGLGGAAARPKAASPSGFAVEPYVWVPSVKGDVSDGEGGGSGIDLVGLEDLSSFLMVAGGLRAAGSAWGGTFDVVNVRLDDDEGLLDTEVGLQMLEAAAVWAPAGWGGIEVIGGLRHWRVDAELALGGLVPRRREESWVDPVLGVRAARPLGRGWSLHGRADLGGFQLTADWIVQLSASLRCALTESLDAHFGYRRVALDASDKGLDFDVAGPSIGLRWSF